VLQIHARMQHPRKYESPVTVRVLRPGSQITAVSLLPPPRRRRLRRHIDLLSLAVCLWFAMCVGFALLVVAAVRAVL
jgi:hypothetical protein